MAQNTNLDQQQAENRIDTRVKITIMVLCSIVLILIISLVILSIKSEPNSSDDTDDWLPPKPDIINEECNVYSTSYENKHTSFVRSDEHPWNLNATFTGHIYFYLDKSYYLGPKFHTIQSEDIDFNLKKITLKASCLTLSLVIYESSYIRFAMSDIRIPGVDKKYPNTYADKTFGYTEIAPYARCISTSTQDITPMAEGNLKIYMSIKICY